MWRLLRDQIERSGWPLLVSFLVAGIALLGPSSGTLQSRPTGDLGRLFVRLFITTFPTFFTASMGYISTLADPRYGHGRTVQILPLGRRELARALWLATALPGVIIGSLVCALVALAQITFDPGDSPRSLLDILVPTIAAATLGSAMSVVMWSYLSVTNHVPETARRIIGVVLFHQLWYLAWLGSATRFGLLAFEPMLIVLSAAAVAGSCVLLSPRLWMFPAPRPHSSSVGRPDVSLDRRKNESRLIGLAVRASAHALGFAFLVNAGFLMAILAHRPLGRAFSLPFRLRWMVLVTYAVVWFWFSSWRAALRTLRCLPVSGTKLVIVSIGGCSLIYLAGTLAVLASLLFEPEQARRALGELPFIVLLALGSSLFLAGIALHVERPMVLHQLFGFGFLVLPNALFLPLIAGNGTWLVGFTWQTWLWSYAGRSAVLLTALGVAAMTHSLMVSAAPYRRLPATDRGV
jgi:hypothetical protein